MSIYDNYLYIQTDPPCPAGSVKYTVRQGDLLHIGDTFWNYGKGTSGG